MHKIWHFLGLAFLISEKVGEGRANSYEVYYKDLTHAKKYLIWAISIHSLHKCMIPFAWIAALDLKPS